MDLEMTGLEPETDVIVEIATLITDDDLNIIAEGPDLVIHQSDEVLARMNQIVVDMHTKSGLLEAIKSSTITLEEAGAATLEFIRQHIPEARTIPLCGNSLVAGIQSLVLIVRTRVEHTEHWTTFAPA